MICALYLLIINGTTFVAFAVDKRRAIRGGRRIRERVLLGTAALGGGGGALAAQRIFRHKIRKSPFRTRLWRIAAFELVALVALAAVWIC